MQIRDYAPLTDAAAVLALWDDTLGASYPVSERAFAPRVVYPAGYLPGDGVVAMDGHRLVAFGLLEVGRTSSTVRPGANLAALLVAPAHQRQGLGTQLLQLLETRARAAGARTLMPGAGPGRFWTGLPDDLPAAKAFFARHGYRAVCRTPDMTITLGSYTLPASVTAKLAEHGVRIVHGAPELVPQLLTFETAEFPGWVPNLLQVLNAGDGANILAAMHGDAVIGCLTTFTPGSRWRSANLVWERLLGAQLGGYGAVGMAQAWRGRGIGAVLNQAAIAHVQASGATLCHIDWVGPVAFYEKLGARVWRWFEQVRRDLTANSPEPTA